MDLSYGLARNPNFPCILVELVGIACIFFYCISYIWNILVIIHCQCKTDQALVLVSINLFGRVRVFICQFLAKTGNSTKAYPVLITIFGFQGKDILQDLDWNYRVLFLEMSLAGFFIFLGVRFLEYKKFVC